MIEGGLYATPKGTVGRACRHPLHGDAGRLAYIETAAGDLFAVRVETMRPASPAEAQRYRHTPRRGRGRPKT